MEVTTDHQATITESTLVPWVDSILVLTLVLNLLVTCELLQSTLTYLSLLDPLIQRSLFGSSGEYDQGCPKFQ